MARPSKTFYDKDTNYEVEARRLVGNSARTIRVAMDIADSGYPWLTGNSLEPRTLKNDKGETGTRGIWIDPGTGELVIRETLALEHRAAYGDWIYQLADGTFQTATHENFHAQFQGRPNNG